MISQTDRLQLVLVQLNLISLAPSSSQFFLQSTGGVVVGVAAVRGASQCFHGSLEVVDLRLETRDLLLVQRVLLERDALRLLQTVVLLENLLQVCLRARKLQRQDLANLRAARSRSCKHRGTHHVIVM